MLYSSAGFLALIIHLVINHDVLRKAQSEDPIPAHLTYRLFMIAVTVYYVTDILWGMLYERGLIALTFADTALYFAAMAVSILLWTRFAVAYMKEKTRFDSVLILAGWLIFALQMLLLTANFFFPVLYIFEADGTYQAMPGRYLVLTMQIIMFTMTAVYALVISLRSSGTIRLRHRTIALSSIVMAIAVTAQAYFPLLPLYALGCVLSSCVLHSFLLENEKEEYRDALKEKLENSILMGNYYDLLTGLPGMSYFFELAEAGRASLANNGGCAFLYMNLSGLKFYNQRHGFAEGDRLLRTFAHLLISAFGSDHCSRFGQDHFVVFTKQVGLEDALRELFDQWEKQNVRECPAIRAGIYLDSIANVDIATACDLAKIACDADHRSYASSMAYYDNDMLAAAERRQYVITHLDQALAERWVQVYYQPIVRATNGRVCDEEALARWIDPERGFLSPADFIPTLEEAGIVYKLDLYVVERILEKIERLREARLHIVPQSINLSRSDFDACDIVAEIVKRVDNAGLPHSLLTIEITESTVGSNYEFIREQVGRFRDLGFPVWLDDFGNGYSSLDVLQSMNVDLIKLDMRFMQQFNNGEKSRVILAELMKMAIGLGIDTICEGVERADQVEFLREIGCSKLQGFFYAKPMPMEEILRRYDTGTAIGFENPDEANYFDAIGRINLFDLAVIAKGDEDTLQHYFSTVPMAIIEVRGNKSRFTRSNQAYRDFMKRTFGISLASLGNGFEETPEGPGISFVRMLRQCCQNGGRTMFDEAMSDGTVVHSFMRRIAENPLTGTVAAVVAVLAIGKK